jgi:phosphopantothenoylcysteine decarboxylase/phosphopantothenate--cysteine ligase
VVTLISGSTSLPAPAGVDRVDVLTASEMHKAVMKRAKQADVFISVAAVADYRPVESKPHKIKRGNGHMSLDLELNPDILAEVAAMPRGPFCVGFAAETEDLLKNAQAKRKKKGIPLLAANLANETFGKDTNALTLFDEAGVHELPRATKIVLARQLVEYIAKLLPRR